MPLAGTGNVLGDALKAAVDQVVATATAAQKQVDRTAMFEAMGQAIVAHIIANATVAVTGVTVGAGVAPGTIT